MKEPDKKAQHVKIAVSGYGTMEFVLLGEAEDGIKNDFIKRAREGFYDGKPVYMVIKDYCFIAGEKKSAEAYNDTPDDNASDLYPFRGALCLTDTSSDGSCDHFTVITTDTDFIDELEELLKFKKVTLEEYFDTAYGVKLDEKTLDLFRTYGGTPWLYGHCRVFGQMVDGFDVLDEIASVSVSDDADFAPYEDILIELVTVY